MNNLFYLKEYPHQVLIKHFEGEEISFEKFKDLIHQLCLLEYTTYRGRLEAIQEIYGLRYNTPIYINNRTILVKIPQDEYNLWVNIINIISIEDVDKYKTVIKFINNEKKMVKESKKRIQEIIKKGEKILSKTV